MIKQNTGSLLIKFLSLMWKQCEITYLKIVEQCMLTRQTAWAAHSTAALQLLCSPEPIFTFQRCRLYPVLVLPSFFISFPLINYGILITILRWIAIDKTEYWLISARVPPIPKPSQSQKMSLNLHSKNCKSRTLHTSNPLKPSPPFICIIWL